MRPLRCRTVHRRWLFVLVAVLAGAPARPVAGGIEPLGDGAGPGDQPADAREDRPRPHAVLRPAALRRRHDELRELPHSRAGVRRRPGDRAELPDHPQLAQLADARQRRLPEAALSRRPRREPRGAGALPADVGVRDEPEPGFRRGGAALRPRVRRGVHACLRLPRHHARADRAWRSRRSSAPS